MAYASLERTQDARTEFEKSIALAPVQTESYFRLGVLNLNARELAAAAMNFQHVLDRDPKHAGALAALGRVEYDEKKFAESAQLLQRAIASDDSLREAHYYLGLTYARLGRKEESDQQFQIATRLEHEELEKQKADLRIAKPDPSQAQPK
jgi:tetratricopeptide (TPR) repeat protein